MTAPITSRRELDDGTSDPSTDLAATMWTTSPSTDADRMKAVARLGYEANRAGVR